MSKVYEQSHLFNHNKIRNFIQIYIHFSNIGEIYIKIEKITCILEDKL